VASNGGYGDVGQYAVSGTIVPRAGAINAPTSLSAAVSAGEIQQIQLSWTDNATNETGYAVSRSTDGVNWSPIADALPADSTNFADRSVGPGTTYHYLVAAFNAGATSDSSNEALATTAPAAPSGLAATPVSSSRINLSWSDVTGETGFLIERSVDQTTWSQIATTGANVTTYASVGLAASTTYYYRVRATNSGGNSPFSNVASGSTLAAPTLPAAPSGLVAKAITPQRIDLTWVDNSNNESGFLVERSTNGGKSWSKLAQTGADVRTYSDTSVVKRKTYQYRIRAFNDGGTSAPCTAAKVTTPAAMPLPAGVSGLTAVGVSPQRVELSWTDNALTESGFVVERSTNGGKKWTTVARLAAETVAYTDTTVAEGQSYVYRVRAFNSRGYSAAGSLATVRAPSTPQPVSSVAALRALDVCFAEYA
jgi:hypothetical protein